MTSRERLWAVLNRQEPDRVPIWMLYPRQYLPYYADVHHLPSYAGVLPYIMQHTDWLDRRNLPAPMFFTAAVQVKSRVEVNGEWTISHHVLATPYGDLTSETRQDLTSASFSTTEYWCKDIRDLEKVLSIPYEPVEPDLTEFRRAAQALGEAGLMMVDPAMPIGVAYHLLGPENFSIYTLTEREALVKFTRTIFNRHYTFLKKALEAGAGPVFFTVDTEFVAPPMCRPVVFDALIAPFQAPMFELIHRHGGKVIVHHHGNINLLLERIADLGADGIHPVEEPPIGDCGLAEAKRRVGDRVCLVGSLQYDDFERLSPDEMDALVRRQILDAAQGGGMILAPTAGPYATNLTSRQQENTLRFIQAAHKWGRYPLSIPS